MRFPALALPALCALALPASALGAAAGLQDDHLTVAPADQVPARVALLARTGVRITRVDVLWSDVAPARPALAGDPDDPAYRLERLDAVVRELARHRVAPILTVYSAPGWAAGGHRVPAGQVNPISPDPVAYAAFTGMLARRYSGRFTPRGATAPLPQVRAFELWNEPNMVWSWQPQRGAQGRYASLVKAAGARIKAANPRALVLAGAGGPRSTTDRRGTGSRIWLHALARSGARFDVATQHVYPAAPPRQPTRAVPAWATLPDLLRDLRAARPGTPLWVTEAGYTTAATPRRRVRVTPAQQARYLTDIWSLPVVRGQVPVVVWFNLQDNRQWPGGLLFASGRAKPSMAAFRRVAALGTVPAALRGG